MPLSRAIPLDQPIPLLWQKLDPVLGSALIFLMPCVVLAMLSPYMIRLSTQSLAQVGRSSGFIIAASTIGSIAGVFVSGFVLIDQMKVSHIFRVMGGLTVLLGLLCVGLDRLASGRLGAAGRKGADTMKRAPDFHLDVVRRLLCWPVRLARADLVFEATSTYHHIRVVDEERHADAVLRRCPGEPDVHAGPVAGAF